jgi:uncharacterized cupin superfamily protein
MSPKPDTLRRSSVGWIEVPPDALMGAGLSPYREGEIRNLFDWAENVTGRSVHRMPHRGQFIVDVVAFETNAVHQPSKPGDEIVLVLKGTLTLTDDSDRKQQVFQAGEMVLIPAGWAGIYRVHSADGFFHELAIVPGDYFDPGAAPPPSGLSPRRLILPTSTGRHELHRNRYVLELHNVDQPSDWTISEATDEVIQVLAGTLTLEAPDRTGSFKAGSVLVIPRGFSGRARVQPGYRGLHARWIG